MKIWLNAKWGTLEDPKGIFRDVSKVGHWGNGDYEVQIANDDNIEYIFSLSKGLYRSRKN